MFIYIGIIRNKRKEYIKIHAQKRTYLHIVAYVELYFAALFYISVFLSLFLSAPQFHFKPLRYIALDEWAVKIRIKLAGCVGFP